MMRRETLADCIPVLDERMCHQHYCWDGMETVEMRWAGGFLGPGLKDRDHDRGMHTLLFSQLNSIREHLVLEMLGDCLWEGFRRMQCSWFVSLDLLAS